MVANDWVSPEDIRDTEGMLTDSNARLIRTAEQAKVRSLFAERADMKGIVNYKECLGSVVSMLDINQPYVPKKHLTLPPSGSTTAE